MVTPHVPRPPQGPTLVDPEGSAAVPVRWVDVSGAAEAREGQDWTAVSVSRAEGADSCEDKTIPGALFADGAWFVGIQPAATCSWSGEADLPAPDGVGLVAAGSSDIRRWSATDQLVKGDHFRQVTRSAVAGDTAVWGETVSTNLFVDNWRVFTASRADGVPHLVARSEDLTGGKDLPFYESTYAIDGRRAVWSTSPAQPDRAARAYLPEVVSRDLSGKGPIRVLARRADEPVVTADGIVVRTFTKARVVEDREDDPTPEKRWVPTGLALVTASGLRPLVRIDTRDPIDFPSWLGDGVAAYGSKVAFSVGPTEYLLDLEDGSITGFRGGGKVLDEDVVGSDPVRESAVINQSALGDRWLAWTFGGTSGGTDMPVYVASLETGEVRQQPVEHNFGNIWTAGDLVGWTSSSRESSTTTLARWR